MTKAKARKRRTAKSKIIAAINKIRDLFAFQLSSFTFKDNKGNSATSSKEDAIVRKLKKKGWRRIASVVGFSVFKAQIAKEYIRIVFAGVGRPIKFSV